MAGRIRYRTPPPDLRDTMPAGEYLNTYPEIAGQEAGAVLLEGVRALPGAAPRNLQRLRQLQKHTEAMIAAAVQAMRANGSTWSEIAESLGVSKQAAQQRYGR